jgi:hypothetical protein
VSGGQIVVGIASSCDEPLVQGGVGVFNQADGSAVGTYRTVPAGTVGGAVWSSAAASGTTSWVSTGNADQTPGALPGDSFSIVRLSGATAVDRWTVPNLGGTDLDFGASPTLFTGAVTGVSTPLVGACNKNGVFYALRQSALSSGPVWTFKDSSGECISAAVWDGHQLIIGDQNSTVDGVHWNGSIRALSPNATGHRVIWEFGLPCAVLGTPTENGAGIVAVVTWSSCSGGSPALYLFGARSPTPDPLGSPVPTLLNTISLPGGGFSQPTFADGYLFVASQYALTTYK